MRAAKSIATVFGLGYIPFFPGTFGSLFALALSLQLIFINSELSFAVPLFLLLFSLAAGFPAVKKLLESSEDKDPKWIVIDEVAGQSVALLLSPPTFYSYLGAFILFRLFDIVKPFPIGRLERLRGAWGVIADDLLAGVFAGLIILVIMRLK
jgi:phosphatidylglycerophosphatase A